VNFFQPSFKLIWKTREGAQVTKKYPLQATPCERLLARKDISEECKEQLRCTWAARDPVRWRSEMREAQGRLAQLEVGVAHAAAPAERGLNGFGASLATAWRDGEVRPTPRKRVSGPRPWGTRRDPFEKVWLVVEEWLNEPPDANAKDLFLRLQASTAEVFPPGQRRTLQRRVKPWRSEIARRRVLGVGQEAEKKAEYSIAGQESGE